MRFTETFAMMVVVAGAASATTWFVTMDSLNARLAAFAEHRPPLAVIDYASVYEALKAGVSPSNLQVEFDRIGAAGDRLADAGYLVFTSAQVVKVPEGSMVSAPPIAVSDTMLPTAPDAPLNLGSIVEGLTPSVKVTQ